MPQYNYRAESLDTFNAHKLHVVGIADLLNDNLSQAMSRASARWYLLRIIHEYEIGAYNRGMLALKNLPLAFS